MKKTLLISTLVVGLLNLFQLASSYQQRQAAFSDTLASQTGVTLRPASTKAAAIPTASTAQAAQAAPTAAPVEATATADPVTATAQKLTAAGFKADYASLYLAIQAQTGTPWQLLAAVHKVETGQRGDTAVSSSAGAQGPMQFMPATFRAYAADGDGNGSRTITDLDDAMMTAGRYLAANGADSGDYRTALYGYNHSGAYVSKVLGLARQLGL
jgi:membrane-bound lytic murein transglycosylase B